MEETIAVKKMIWWETLKSAVGFSKPIRKEITAASEGMRWGTLLYSTPYSGEKNLGEIGPLKNYNPQTETLRARSWDAYLTNEIPHIIINKYSTWVIGKGLKLHSEPNKTLLESEGIVLDVNKFSELGEARFETWANCDMCDYSSKKNLGMLEATAYKNTKIGGDCLVILRIVNKCVKIQLIDGVHVRSPKGYGTEYFPQVLPNGNRIMNGVEMDETGAHIAYYVYSDDPLKLLQYDRIECRGKKTGLKMAFLLSGLEYRIHNVRTLPAISTMLESLAKLERYKEATLGSAEEKAKIAYSIEHEQFSTGENPMLNNVLKASNIGGNPTGELARSADGQKVADNVTMTTNKQAWNMPLGSKLVLHENKGEIQFKPFYDTFFDSICAAFGAPPEVMRSKYDSNFSSARAAIKDWEHTLNVERAHFSYEFNKPIWDLFLELEILNLKIPAPGYILARLNGNYYIVEAYRKARFVGANVPHIDPLKEVNAERAKLGDATMSIPLTTIQAATEALNGGDSDANLEQVSTEIAAAKKLGVILPPPVKIPAIP